MTTTLTPVTLSTDELRDHGKRERDRAHECPYRRHRVPIGSCGLIDVNRGVPSPLHMDHCDQCWAANPAEKTAALLRRDFPEAKLVKGADQRPCGGRGPLKRPIPNVFDRVYVVNLQSRGDRWKEFMAAWGTVDWPFSLSPVRWEGVPGAKLPLPHGWTSGHGAYGCMLSHRGILERCILDGVESVLILEDDALFVDEFGERCRQFLRDVPADWDGLMLGGQHIRVEVNPPPKVGEGVVRCLNCHRTHAYALRGDYLKDVYQLWCTSTKHIDHHMGPFQKRYKVYAPDRMLVAQRESISDITLRVARRSTWDTPDGSVPVYMFTRPPTREERASAHFGYKLVDGVDKGLRQIVALACPGERVRQLRAWVNMLDWEATAINKPIGVWHPKLQAAELSKAVGGRMETCG